MTPPRNVRGRQRGRQAPTDGVEPAHRVHVVDEHHHQGHVQVQALAEHPHVVGQHEELEQHVEDTAVQLEKKKKTVTLHCREPSGRIIRPDGK